MGNKNCRIVYDIWTRCWDSEAGQVTRGGVGLMSDWYDGCAGMMFLYLTCVTVSINLDVSFKATKLFKLLLNLHTFRYKTS